MDVNRRYFVHYVRANAAPGSTVLDYGCGTGELVQLLRDAGFDAYGVDIRWPGGDFGRVQESELGRRGVLRFYEEGGTLPFDDDAFDVVVSDQVLEHVAPFEQSVRELERVCRPGGLIYHHFPSRAVWREGHIGIPLAHRLPKGRARLAYATALRRLGAGIYKDERPAREWAAEKLDWVDRWAIYRSAGEIHAVLGARADIAHRELDYCRFRAADRRWLAALVDLPGARRPAAALFRRLAFEAIEVRPQHDPRSL
jgi:SAM-dependent methyltransferase